MDHYSPPLSLALLRQDPALISFAIYSLAVLAIAGLAHRFARGKSFLGEYFLGSRGLGAWAFALTAAATSASGGSFMGFPAKVYSHGWVLALWIGSYMVVPLFLMGLLAKRLNQLARKTGAITVPDFIRDRFGSRALGGVAIALIIFFMAVVLVAQFKAGAQILRTLLDDQPLFHEAAHRTGELAAEYGVTTGSEGPAYALCLLSFAVVVIVYTSYGGFRAVVWTDVMQGLVMLAGVMVMLPLALWQSGGLEHVTQEKMMKMTPPRFVTARVTMAEPVVEDFALAKGDWLVTGTGQQRRVFRLAERAIVVAATQSVQPIGAAQSDTRISLLELTTPEEVATIEPTWPGRDFDVQVVETRQYQFGAGKPGVYVTGPGPDETESLGFLPLSLAICFFLQWALGNAGHPSYMVRLMAFRDTLTLRRSLVMVAVYYSLIYFPLVVIFCCARVLLPGWEIDPDRIMPEMAKFLTYAAGHPWLAGILVAAPFAAVMSTVDSFLLVISSAVVRDVYQRNIDPDASEKTVKRLSYAATGVIGLAAVVGAMFPPAYLQDIIVYVGSGLMCCFLVPVAMALYWPRANTAGAMAGMLAGYFTHLSLYVAGFVKYDRFQAIHLWNFDPNLPALAASLAAAVAVTLATAPPAQERVRRFFHAESG